LLPPSRKTARSFAKWLSTSRFGNTLAPQNVRPGADAMVHLRLIVLKSVVFQHHSNQCDS
jgi:hypothetical protein